MKPLPFLSLLGKRGIEILKKGHYSGNWGRRTQIPNLKEYKELTELVNYGCVFVDGKCKGLSERCCCAGCHQNVGYLGAINHEDFEEYAKLFNNKVGFGFWTKNGCSLPRELRSVICLTYCCDSEKLSVAERELFQILRNGEEEASSYCARHSTGDALKHLKKRLEDGKT